MNFLSWNVNGIRAFWNHGLHRYLENCGADFICLQETRTNTQPEYTALNGYESYWSFCDRKKGYSGTVVFTKHRPLRTTRSFDVSGFDTEGRLITLEYDEFVLVNAYFPRPYATGVRYDYRQRFDALMRDHLVRLRAKKPVIVCGDFNVPLAEEDVYSNSPWRQEHEEGFQTPEQDSLCTILGNGYVDSYRYAHPERVDRFTFWTNRWNKRDVNEGWRIDYFLVSSDLVSRIRDAQILDLARGSDHCPITLDIELDLDPDREVKRLQRMNYTYAGLLKMESRQESFSRVARLDLAHVWETFDKAEAEARVREMQRAIALAARREDMQKVHKLQVKLMMSLDTRFLAVNHVSHAASSVGIDEIEWSTPNERVHAALALDIWGYRALPAIIVKMKTKGGRVRNTSLLPHHDRAIDKLAAYALNPVSATSGDLHSYAFREGRGPRDFVHRVITLFEGRKGADFAVIVDVQKYYDSINHDFVLETISLPGTVLREFLKAGFLDSKEYCETEEGIPIGSALSPIIGNMVLDGLESALDELREKEGMDERSCKLARWADDIVISAATMRDAISIRASVDSFLLERGLQASFEKSRMVDVHEGFEVLSKRFVKNARGRVLCSPTERSAELFLGDVEDFLKGFKGGQEKLISKLNRKLDGWFNYHKYHGLPSMFRKVDVGITALLLDYTMRKHPSRSADAVKRKFFAIDDRGRPFYCLPKNRNVRVKFIADAIGINHSPVDVRMNPYINTTYFAKRSSQRDISNVSGKYRHVYLRQKGRCFACGKELLVDQPKSIIEVVNPNSPMKTIEAYVHASCADCAVVHFDVDTLPFTTEDTKELLRKYISSKSKVNPKYQALFTFLVSSVQDTVTLRFDRIERIIGSKLGSDSQSYQFWQMSGYETIGRCFRESGFLIDAVRLAPVNEVSLFRFRQQG